MALPLFIPVGIGILALLGFSGKNQENALSNDATGDKALPTGTGGAAINPLLPEQTGANSDTDPTSQAPLVPAIDPIGSNSVLDDNFLSYPVTPQMMPAAPALVPKEQNGVPIEIAPVTVGVTAPSLSTGTIFDTWTAPVISSSPSSTTFDTFGLTPTGAGEIVGPMSPRPGIW